MGQSSVFATSAMRRSLSSCSIAHSSNVFRCLVTVSALAVWGVNYFEPVEVRFNVPVARDYGCEVYFCV